MATIPPVSPLPLRSRSEGKIQTGVTGTLPSRINTRSVIILVYYTIEYMLRVPSSTSELSGLPEAASRRAGCERATAWVRRTPPVHPSEPGKLARNLVD